ncbi:hypothetical protein J6590_009783 [Homalodisca vitripennis]|nr:hypothetical protein J6590_009783 [Homalodisca vitripennis]
MKYDSDHNKLRVELLVSVPLTQHHVNHPRHKYLRMSLFSSSQIHEMAGCHGNLEIDKFVYHPT